MQSISISDRNSDRNSDENDVVQVGTHFVRKGTHLQEMRDSTNFKDDAKMLKRGMNED